MRNVGSAIGMSVATALIARKTQAMHEMISAWVTPFNRALRTTDTMRHWLDPATRHGAMMLDRMINQQGQIVALLIRPRRRAEQQAAE